MLKPLTKDLTPNSLKSTLHQNMFRRLIPEHLELVPQLNEVYELELAFYESEIMSADEILRNGAYFARVNGHPTRHFLICQGEPLKLAEHSSSRLQSFFKTNQFKTGYATNGLFPYRGKFHPQMIKGLINIMGLKPGDTVLDPMMGSGTVLIEATLMGINSVGIDSSPFCAFMTKAKLDGLNVPLRYLKAAVKDFDSTCKYFSDKVGDLQRTLPREQVKLFEQFPNKGRKAGIPYWAKKQDVEDYLMLAFLDAKGYSERSKRASFKEQFEAILERYYFVADKIQKVLNGFQEEMGKADSRTGDARDMGIESESIDGVIFSPPYSFAIDYLQNDAYHLNAIGVDVEELRKSMIGLHGRNLKDKYEKYLADMDMVIAECSRVLKPGKICSIVVGTNNNQLSKILKVAPEDVKGIHEQLIDMAKRYDMELIRAIERQITGMANTMRSEFIVMLQKN